MNISNEDLFAVTETVEQLQDKIKNYLSSHLNFLNKMLSQPYHYYKIFKDRFQQDGLNAPWPELEDTVNYLITHIKIKLLYIADNTLKNVAYLKLIKLFNIAYQAKQRPFPYGETIRTIADALEFFDIYERQYNANGLGVYYHSLNYRYYLNNLLDIQFIEQYIFFPTFHKKLNATDIINLRSVPIFFCGVSIEKMYVDEFWQSPIEFFMHDMNHSRRMGKNMLTKMTQMEESLCFRDDFNQLTKIKPFDRAEVKAMKQLMRLLVFEIVHEDALYLLPEIIWDALHRGHDYIYVFERSFLNEENKLDAKDHPINVEGALAYTKYKLQHQFYDDGTKDWLVIPHFRYANYLVFAALILLIFIKIRYCKFHHKQIQTYKYYLNRTCSNALIPRPIHHFKVDKDENINNVDSTSLKTGLAQNSWKKGYRRVVGEHIESSLKTMSSEIAQDEVKINFDAVAHREDFKLFQIIFAYFREQHPLLANANIKLNETADGGHIDILI